MTRQERIETLEIARAEVEWEYPLDYYVALDETIKELKHDGWILTKDKLPDTDDAFIVTWVNHNPESYYAEIKDVPFIGFAYYQRGRWYWYSATCLDVIREYGDSPYDRVQADIEIVAWMETPRPYREEDK